MIVDKKKVKSYISYLKVKCRMCSFKGKTCNDCDTEHIAKLLERIKTKRIIKTSQ